MLMSFSMNKTHLIGDFVRQFVLNTKDLKLLVTTDFFVIALCAFLSR